MAETALRRKRTGRAFGKRAGRMSSDARLVYSMTGRMLKVALAENQHQTPPPPRRRHGSHYTKSNPRQCSPNTEDGSSPILAGRPIHAPSHPGESGRQDEKIADRWMTETYEGDSGKYRRQAQEQALPSQASPAHTPIPEPKDLLVEPQSSHIGVDTCSRLFRFLIPGAQPSERVVEAGPRPWGTGLIGQA